MSDIAMSLGAPSIDAAVTARSAMQAQQAGAESGSPFAALLAVALAPAQVEPAKSPALPAVPAGAEGVTTESESAASMPAPSFGGQLAAGDPARILMMLSFALREAAASAETLASAPDAAQSTTTEIGTASNTPTDAAASPTLAPSTYLQSPVLPAAKIDVAPSAKELAANPLMQLAPELRARVERVLARAQGELGHSVQVVDAHATDAPPQTRASSKRQPRTLDALMRIAREEGLETQIAAPDEAASMFEAVGVGMTVSAPRRMAGALQNRVAHSAATKSDASAQRAGAIPAPVAIDELARLDLAPAVSVPVAEGFAPALGAIPVAPTVPVIPIAAAPTPAAPAKVVRVPEAPRITLAARGAPPERQDTTAIPDGRNPSVATTPVSFAGGVDANVADLMPAFRGKLERVVDRMRSEFGYDVQVVETYRGQDRQNQLFAQGRTTAGPVVTWTQASKHTAARAADVVIDGTFDNPVAYTRLAQVAKEEGLRTLGARDPGHLELPFDGAPVVSADATSVSIGASTRGSANKIATPFSPATVASTTVPAQPAAVAHTAAVAQVAAVAIPGMPVARTASGEKNTVITRNATRTVASIVTPVSVPRTVPQARVAALDDATDSARAAPAAARQDKREATDVRDGPAPTARPSAAA
ncbi:MAG: M15 family metallopeptidase, partial [Gemmatimonadota bacterium]|nr:M15 family metallopeptidase [Gemmatimonadota bacterium]